jgi:hypothetical protein
MLVEGAVARSLASWVEHLRENVLTSNPDAVVSDLNDDIAAVNLLQSDLYRDRLETFAVLNRKASGHSVIDELAQRLMEVELLASETLEVLVRVKGRGEGFGGQGSQHEVYARARSDVSSGRRNHPFRQLAS